MKNGTDKLLKFAQLKRDLGLKKYALKGLLQDLWDFTRDNAPAGDIGKHSNEDIALMLEWEGAPDALICALVARGWLDESAEHRLVVHDWPAHCEDSIHLRLARETRYFADGSAPKLTRLNKEERAQVIQKYRLAKSKQIEDTGGGNTEAHKSASTRTPCAQNTHYHTDPSRALPNRAAPEGSDARKRAGSGRSVEPMEREEAINRVLALTEEGPEYREWWGEVFDSIESLGKAEVLFSRIRETEVRMDPILSKSKRLPKLDNVGGFIAKPCQDAGVHLPARPRVAV